MASVRPVPFPFSFVVKQGSSIRTCGGRIALARFLARAPTEPDVRDQRIRLFEIRIRYAGRAMVGVKSGYRVRSRVIASQERPHCERRRNARHQLLSTQCSSDVNRFPLPLRP